MIEDTQGIHEVLKRLESAWNAGDSVAFAAAFTEDADFIHIYGGRLEGRPAIEASHRHIFQTVYMGSRAAFTMNKIRMVRPGVAIAFTQAHLEFFVDGARREMDTRPTLILVKGSEVWQIVVFQNTRISEMPS